MLLSRVVSKIHLILSFSIPLIWCIFLLFGLILIVSMVFLLHQNENSFTLFRHAHILHKFFKYKRLSQFSRWFKALFLHIVSYVHFGGMVDISYPWKIVWIFCMAKHISAPFFFGCCYLAQVNVPMNISFEHGIKSLLYHIWEEAHQCNPKNAWYIRWADGKKKKKMTSFDGAVIFMQFRSLLLSHE